MQILLKQVKNFINKKKGKKKKEKTKQNMFSDICADHNETIKCNKFIRDFLLSFSLPNT